ncbi:hypothetical protein KC342_g12011 [Hortaea werneckii]|nr:hypothetical protein KC342_g12011 [Hortaea werneckii]
MGLFSRKNHFDVHGRTILLTGGSQGMGRGLAKLLAEKGANIVIVARNQQARAQNGKNPKTRQERNQTRTPFSPLSS